MIYSQATLALTLRQIELWETMFDWMNNISEKSFKVKRNQRCYVIGKQMINNQTFFKLEIEGSRKTGWLETGKDSTFEVQNGLL